MEALALRQDSQLQTRETLNALVESFAKAQDVKPSSRATYKRMLSRFVDWLTKNPAQEISRGTILAYKASLEDKKLSSLTLSGYLVAVRKFFEWTEANKLYPNIARGVKGGKRPWGHRKESLTVDQIKELLASLDRSTLEGRRDYALLNLLVRTGLRTIEAVRADIGDIRQEGGEAVLWIQGKGRDAKDEFVLLTPDTLKPIREYLSERGNQDDTAPLFASLSDRNRNERLTTRTLSRIAKVTLRGIGLNSGRLTAHSLRHTALTLSVVAGNSLQQTQALGRHKNINTTMIYVHNINRIANAPERKIEELLKAS